VTAAYPRGPDFERWMIGTFYQGLKHRPESTFGTFNDDFLACMDSRFHRTDVCASLCAHLGPIDGFIALRADAGDMPLSE
jgi:hypothetical protein